MRNPDENDYEYGYQVGLSYETPDWVGQLVWVSENPGSRTETIRCTADFCRGYHNGRVVRAHATDLDLCQSAEDVQDFESRLISEKRDWVTNKVRPYLVALLDMAQSKIQWPVKFFNGGGVSLFALEESSCFETMLNTAIMEPYGLSDGPILPKVRQRFPELVKLYEIVVAVSDKFNMDVGDVTPTIAP